MKTVPIESSRWWQRGPSFLWTFNSLTRVSSFLIRGSYTERDTVMSIKVAGIEQVVRPFPVSLLFGTVSLALPTLQPGVPFKMQTWGRFRAELAPVGEHYLK